MRIATLIVSLFLMAAVGLQSCSVYALGNEDGALGIVVALLFLLGAAFALALPRVSLVVFAIATVLALFVYAGTSFSDMGIWALVSLALVVMSYFGVREKRRAAEGLPPSSELVSEQPTREGPDAANPSMQRRSPAEALRELTELRDAGLITLEEFEAKKSEILRRM
jgi:hypothetical protein